MQQDRVNSFISKPAQLGGLAKKKTLTAPPVQLTGIPF